MLVQLSDKSFQKGRAMKNPDDAVLMDITIPLEKNTVANFLRRCSMKGTQKLMDQAKISETQSQINKMCNVDEETFLKYGPKSGEAGAGVDAASLVDETQRLINALFGIGDEKDQAQDKADKQEAEVPMSDTQRLINKLMGVDDATFYKYRPK